MPTFLADWLHLKAAYPSLAQNGQCSLADEEDAIGGRREVVSEPDSDVLVEAHIKDLVRVEPVAGGANQSRVTWPDLKNSTDATVVTEERTYRGRYVRRRWKPLRRFERPEHHPIRAG